jgi:hypothetical protein
MPRASELHPGSAHSGRWVSLTNEAALINTCLSPTAFEKWMGERFRELGYSVRLTLASGDHGVDLIVIRDGETVVVQCKRYRATTVGEPILRDLYGAMHHAGASRAILVTTGRLTRGALEWSNGKAVEMWDGHELVRCWPNEIGELAKQKPAGIPVKRAIAKRGDNWFVYTTDDGRRWAVKLSPLLGNNPSLGFERLDDPTLPELPARPGPGRVGRLPGTPVRRIKMRLVIAQAIDHPKKPIRRVPVGTKQVWDPFLRGHGQTQLVLARSDGSQETALVINHTWESVTYDKSWSLARAGSTGQP